MDAKKKLELALAACRSIRFATTNATRFGGEYSLNDLLAADRLAREALLANCESQQSKPAKKPTARKA